MLTYLLTLLENDDDRALLTEIYKKYDKWLNYVACDGLLNSSDADDCVQETFIELIKSFGSFKKVPEERRKAYITKICRRVIYRMNNNAEGTLSYEETTDDNYSLESEFDFSVYDRSDMAHIIKELEPDYREPLMMKYGSGYSAEEISEMLGISINLVYQRIYRGKSILYDRLTKE